MGDGFAPRDPTRSFWRQTEEERRHRNDNAHEKGITTASVVVIGSGMSGTSAFFHLAKRGADVVLIDGRRRGCDGATGRNGGIIHPYTYAMLPIMWRTRSLLDALYLVRLETSGRDAIREIARRYEIECDLVRDVDAMELHENEGTLRARLGVWRYVEPIVSLFGGVDILRGKSALKDALRLKSTAPYASAVVSRRCCDTFWARKFVQGVADVATSTYGARMMFGRRALDIVRVTQDRADGKCLEVHLDGGARIVCNKVVVAINAWTFSLLPEFRDLIVPIRNHLIATSPIRRLVNDREGSACVGFSANGGFIYGQQRKDGRLIIGGFRDTESDESYGVGHWNDAVGDASVFEEIKSYVERTFDLDGPITVEDEWTGIIGWSCDDTPWVGPVPGRPGVFVCAGFNGHGMPQTFLCGRMVAEMVLGTVHPDLFVEAFRPDFSRRHTATYTTGHTADEGL